jgi:surface protein
MDLLAGDADVEKDALVHSLAAADLDYDGEVTGAGTIAHIDVSTGADLPNQQVIFQREGDFYYGLVTMNGGDEIESTLTYDPITNLMTCSYITPENHNDEDVYTLHVSLKDSVAPVATYQLTADNYSVDEGQTVTVTLNTAHVADGTQIPYTISGTNIDLNDFDGLGSLTGTFTVNGGTATASFITAADQTTEGTEVFTLALDNGEAVVSVTINDESKGIVLQGLKMAVIVGDNNYGDGSLQYRLGGRGDYTEINWGDGNTDTYNNIGQQSYDSIAHTYSTPGTYIIEVKGNGVINPYAPHYSNTKWNRTGMPLYDAAYDTGNVGPFGMNRPAIELDFSTVTNLSVSGTTMTITDSANTDWASIVTGASYSDAIGGAMQMILNNERYWSEITSAVTNGNTTTITIANGDFYAQNVGNLELAILDDGAAAVISDLVTYPIQMTLRPDLSQHPNFRVYNANYFVTDGMWDLDRNLPTVSHGLKLTQITHWGTEFTHTMNGASGTRFTNCKNMDIVATDSPDFTTMTNLVSMFQGCESLVDSNSTLNNSSVCGPNITNIQATFLECSLYNGDLDNWDTSNVTDMLRTFKQCSVFNGNIENWNTSNVTTLYATFRECPLFNRDVNTKVRADGQLAWDTSSVSNFTITFGYATSFNKSIDKWRVSGSINQMFSNATSFNQPLLTQQVTVGGNTYVAWDTSDVDDFKSVFYSATSFNGDISNWNTSDSQTFLSMFHGATSFDQYIDTHSVTVTGVGTYDAWNTKRTTGSAYVSKFKNMFFGAKSFNQDLNNWDVTDGNTLASMFYTAYSFNGDISNWDVSGKTSFSAMFLRAWNFNQNIGGWITSSATNMKQMFFMAYSFDQDLNNWDVSNVYTFESMFNNARKKTGITGDWNFNNWQIKQSGTVSMSYMFGDYANISTYDPAAEGANPGGGVVTTSEPMWSPLIDQWNTSYVTTMASMFTYRQTPESVQNINVSNWDTQRLESMSNIFYGATHGIPGTENWNLPVLSNASNAYFSTTLGDVNLANIGNSGNLTNIRGMFYGCQGAFTGLGLEHWDVSACTNLAQFQWGGTCPFNPDITGWDVSSVTSLSQAFSGCPDFNRDLSNWDVSNVTSFKEAFYACATLDFDPSVWDISSATDMAQMYHSHGAKTWDQTRLNNVMASWGTQNVQSNVSLRIDTVGGASVSNLTGAGLTGYNNLVNNYNWSISVS